MDIHPSIKHVAQMMSCGFDIMVDIQTTVDPHAKRGQADSQRQYAYAKAVADLHQRVALHQDECPICNGTYNPPPVPAPQSPEPTDTRKCATCFCFQPGQTPRHQGYCSHPVRWRHPHAPKPTVWKSHLCSHWWPGQLDDNIPWDHTP